MNITIVSGSHRKVSQSIKIAKAIKSALKPFKECDEANIFDLANNPLPLWNEDLDLDYLGRKDFLSISSNFYRELKEYGMVKNKNHWDEILR